MDSSAIAVAAAAIIAIILLIFYVVASWRERGQNPYWSAEVYLCFDPAAPNARIATVGQVEVYISAGGSAHGYGYVADGTIVGAAPAADGLGGLTAAVWPCATPPVPVGVWLYGAKPRRGTRGVIPFSCASWFHPA